jgi:hypothetical protein
VRWVTFLLVVLIAGSITSDATAKGKHHHKNISYFGSFTASGSASQQSTCNYSGSASWQMEGTYPKSRIEPAGELDLKQGGASGRIDWTRDDCVGNFESGTCSIALDPPNYALPVWLYKAKGGIFVDFQLSLTTVGCGYATVTPYAYSGYLPGIPDSPHGFIPSKKIGNDVITVPLSGHYSSKSTNESGSGQMSGTLRLTHKPELQTLPN